MLADPLQTAREAIERAAAATVSHARLLVSGAGAIGAIARERARALASESQPVLILEVRHHGDGARVKIINASGAMPQSLEFNLSSSSDRESLAKFTRSMQLSRFEILDPANVPFLLLDLLLKLKIPYDIFIADAGLLGPHNTPACGAALQSLAAPAIDRSREVPEQDWTDRWRMIADGAQRILVPCSEAEDFAASLLPRRTFEKIERPDGSRSRAKRKTSKAAAFRLGFLPVRSCAHEQWLMSEIAHRFGANRPEVAITVIGTALDDIGLMRCGNTFVTGAVNPEEFEHLVDALDLGYLFISTTRPLFGHPILSSALSSSLPTAYFDWSMGRIKPKKTNLPIDPRSSLDDIVGGLSRWMPGS
jgi:hypothetical protein